MNFDLDSEIRRHSDNLQARQQRDVASEYASGFSQQLRGDLSNPAGSQAAKRLKPFLT
jgi:hypothetical protein